MRDIVTIDCQYRGLPRFAAAYLVVEGERAAFVDNNTVHAIPRLLSTLEEVGLRPEQVEYLVVTHVHLDHAAGTAALAAACPRATVLAHPRAAPHLADPTKLVGSATAVYGAEAFRQLYGSVDPVPADRIRTVEDGESVRLGSRELRFLHTRGHANHHFCVVDPAAAAVIAGDAFGLIYPELQNDGTFAFPSTSPTDFDALLAKESIRRIVAEEPRRVFVSHYGEVTRVQEAADQLTRHLDFAGTLVVEAAASEVPDGALDRWVDDRYRSYFRGLLDGRGGLAARPGTWSLLEMDLGLNAQGLAFAARRRRKKAPDMAESAG
jgi:glyoxylase-like metal-dependent hydrolase (beta-lactamase superfamily II)